MSPLLVTLPPASILPLETGALVTIGLMSVFSAFLPQLVYVTFAPRLGAVTTAVAGSAELPTMFLIGWVVFGEALSPAHLAAALLIVTAIAITPQRPPATRMHAPLHAAPREAGGPGAPPG